MKYFQVPTKLTEKVVDIYWNISQIICELCLESRKGNLNVFIDNDQIEIFEKVGFFYEEK